MDFNSTVTCRSLQAWKPTKNLETNYLGEAIDFVLLAPTLSIYMSTYLSVACSFKSLSSKELTVIYRENWFLHFIFTETLSGRIS